MFQRPYFQVLIERLQERETSKWFCWFFLHLLDTAGLLAGIKKSTGEELRERSPSPKFQVHNTALLTAQQGASLDEVKVQPDVWGRWWMQRSEHTLSIIN